MTPSAGGLATALTSYFKAGCNDRQFDSLHWIGVSDLSKKASERLANYGSLNKDGISMHPVILSPRMRDSFYDGFCNSVLWPLFLYFPSIVLYKREFFEDYVKANQIMCDKVLEIYEEEDIIWVHDYHWMLMPQMLREKRPEARIGFFLHIPFPSFELYRMLPKPWRSQLLNGLMGANVVSFQTEDYALHFGDTVSRLLPNVERKGDTFFSKDRFVDLRVFPISIDYQKFNSMSRLPETRKRVRRIREKLKVSKLILSVDRLDYTKAIFSRLESFELFLEQNPGYHEEISYILLMVPTRESIPKYKENKSTVEALVSRINGKYSTLGWTPVVYLYQTMDFEKLVSLYCAADIGLIVPYRDGMNLVAKEYVACKAGSDGVLILSETAGSAAELDSAILVNPNDRQEVADAIVQALHMPAAERTQRMTRMQQTVSESNVNRWASKFLDTFTDVNEKADVQP